MKTITKEYNIYTFDELSEDVKRKVIDKAKQSEEECYCESCLEDDINVYTEEVLIKDYFEGAYGIKVYYDLSYSQGSGSCCNFNIKLEDLNKKYKILSDEEIRFISDKGLLDEIRVLHNNNHYYHEYTFKVDYYCYVGDYDYEDIKDDYNITESEFATIESRIDNLLNDYNKHYTESLFIKDIISLNKDITKYGYDCIEYYWKDESVIDLVKEDEYYENGDIYS